MHYKVYENVFDNTVTDNILDYFNSHQNNVHVTNGMYKINYPWFDPYIKRLINPQLKKYFDTTLHNIGDNIYKHKRPYFPHVDISVGYPCFNVLIPIKVENDIDQKFCIFDQYVNDFSFGSTWVGEWFDNMEDFEHNKKRRYVYNDNIVENATNADIDIDFYNRNLKSEGRSRSLFKGLSGIAVDFKPGNLIIFDSKFIHCTGKMDCNWKVGLSLRFMGDFLKEVK